MLWFIFGKYVGRQFLFFIFLFFIQFIWKGTMHNFNINVSISCIVPNLANG